MENDDHIGNYIKLHRLNHKLTQEELAELIGVTRQSIYAYETCRRVPSRRHMEDISYYLDMPYEQYYAIYITSKCNR